MNKLCKNLNIFGFCAVALAAGIVFTQSAFTPAKSKAALIYGYDQTHPENPWVLDGTPGYSCQLSQQICKYEFDTAPKPTTSPDEGRPQPNSDIGSYQQD